MVGRRFDFGQCTVPAAATSGVTAIAAGDAHSLALKQGGTVLAWGCRGSTDDGQCSVPASAGRWATAISASEAQSLALSDPCLVPRVLGMRIASARLVITQRHCRTGQVGYAYSRNSKRDIVISQSRRPGQVLPPNSKVNLIVGRGRRGA